MARVPLATPWVKFCRQLCWLVEWRLNSCFRRDDYSTRFCGQLLVLLPMMRDRLLCLLQQDFCGFRIASLQHAITTFSVDVILERDLRIMRIKLEWVLAFAFEFRIEAIERPVAGFNGQLLLVHPFGHINAVRDAL